MELTYWQDAQCQFLFIMSVHCRKCPKSKVLRKIRKNYRNSFSPEDSGSQKDKSRGGPQPLGATQAVGPGVAVGCHLDGSSTPSCRLFAYIFAPDLKTLEHRSFSPETHLSAAATKNPNSGDRSSCSGTLPGLGISLGVIFITVAASHDAPGIVLHRGWGLYCSYVVISLPWCDLYVIVSIVSTAEFLCNVMLLNWFV